MLRFGGALSLFGTSPVDAVTGDGEWSGSSSELLRLIAWEELMREVGVLAEGEGENSKSYLIVAWFFVGLSDDEMSKVEESDLSGGCVCVLAPAFVA